MNTPPHYLGLPLGRGHVQPLARGLVVEEDAGRQRDEPEEELGRDVGKDAGQPRYLCTLCFERRRGHIEGGRCVSNRCMREASHERPMDEQQSLSHLHESTHTHAPLFSRSFRLRPLSSAPALYPSLTNHPSCCCSPSSAACSRIDRRRLLGLRCCCCHASELRLMLQVKPPPCVPRLAPTTRDGYRGKEGVGASYWISMESDRSRN